MTRGGVLLCLLAAAVGVLGASTGPSPSGSGTLGEPCHHHELNVTGECRRAWHCDHVRERKAYDRRYAAQFCGPKLVCCPPPPAPPPWSAAGKTPPVCPDGRNAPSVPTEEKQLLEWTNQRRKTGCEMPTEVDYDDNEVHIPHIPTNASVIEKKCLAYSLQEYQDAESLLLNVGDVPLCRRHCLNEQSVPFVVGGVDAGEYEFPHMALFLDDDDEPFCGGSLISEDFVLTAAHCPVPALVVLGAHRRNYTEDDLYDEAVTVARVKEHIPHPDYYLSGAEHSDIALLRLDQPVKFSRFVRPACLYTGGGADLKDAVVTGWGYQEYDSGDEGDEPQRASPSEVLQKATVNITSHAECRDKWGSERAVHERQVCALGWDHSRKMVTDACHGDSGGPLQVPAPGHCSHRVMAVVSKGRGCGTHRPGIYTSVAAFADWIQSWVWPCEA